jgi:hypothetical protein
MSFNFKRLSDVSSAESVSENTNVIIEEDGVIKKVSNFFRQILNKIAQVDITEEPSDKSYVLVEEGGSVKRVPKTFIGGSGGGYDIIIYGDMSDEAGYNGKDWQYVKGSYEDLKNMFENGTYPSIAVYAKGYGNTYAGFRVMLVYGIDARYYDDNGNIDILFCRYYDGDNPSHYITAKSDNTLSCWSPE